MSYFKAQAVAIYYKSQKGVVSTEIARVFGYYVVYVYYKDGSVKCVE